MNDILPPIFVSPAAHKQLKRVVKEAFQARETGAAFLDSELRRAEIAETLPANVVKPGSFVRYQLDWGKFSPALKLVYPSDFTNSAREISLLSPIGTAVLGMRRGDTMRVLVPKIGFRTLHIASVVCPEDEGRKYSSVWKGVGHVATA